MKDIAVKTETGIEIPKPILLSYGCATCILKANGECYHKLRDDAMLPEGICPAYQSFLLSFGKGATTLNGLLENFDTHLAEIQSLKDLNDMAKIEQHIKEKNPDREEREELQAQLNMHKIWWAKLNKQATESRARMEDRKSRSEDALAPTKISLIQIHKLIRRADAIEAEYKDA